VSSRGAVAQSVDETCVSRRRRLVVVLPELSHDLHSHYAHYVGLLTELAALVDLAVVVEKGKAADLPGAFVISQQRTHPAARAVELATTLARLRIRGYRTAYGSYSPYFGVVGGIVGRLLGIRTAYWHCRSDFFDTAIGRRLGLRRIALDTLPFLLSLYLSRRVVTGTAGLAEHYVRTFRLPRRKVIVIPNDIDVARFSANRQSRAAKSPPTILFVGRLSMHKGSRLLAPIFKRVATQLPDVRLVIAGGGPEEANVLAELRREVEDERVEPLGYLPNNRVPTLMREADVLLMPTLEAGFPRVLLEAMAAGLSFVASDVGGISEVVGPEARRRLIRAGDVEGYVQETLALLRNADQRKRLAVEGTRHVRRYDVKRVARLFVDELCSGTG
jgi:glycosyltransferase involved in cell wall biosynthesis